jgi:hypothetical protein
VAHGRAGSRKEHLPEWFTGVPAVRREKEAARLRKRKQGSGETWDATQPKCCVVECLNVWHHIFHHSVPAAKKPSHMLLYDPTPAKNATKKATTEEYSI